MSNEPLDLQSDDSSSTSLPWRDFLIDYPPGTRACIPDMLHHNPKGTPPELYTPELELYCASDSCRSLRYCNCSGKITLTTIPPSPTEVYLRYRCRSCNGETKIYSLRVLAAGRPAGEAWKIGEWPRFAPRMSRRLVRLIEPDRELYLQGRLAESLGMGIGAFGYYRRVIENQKNRLLDQIIKVASSSNAPPDTIGRLENAKNESQFGKAVEAVKDLLPSQLLIKTHNPLVLLHTALSKGLHDRSDEECLELAVHIRVILGELADRLDVALKDHAALDRALGQLCSSGD
jgi:hypothetical protein